MGVIAEGRIMPPSPRARAGRHGRDVGSIERMRKPQDGTIVIASRPIVATPTRAGVPQETRARLGPARQRLLAAVTPASRTAETSRRASPGDDEPLAS